MSHCVKRVPQLGHNNRGHTYHLRRSGSCAWRALLRRSCMGALLTPEVNSFLISMPRTAGHGLARIPRCLPE